MAVDYTPGTSGMAAVAKSIPATSVNAATGNVAVEYTPGVMGPVVKPVMSKMLGNAQVTVQSTMTGMTGSR